MHHMHMRTHADILKAAGIDKVVAACPEPSIHTIRSWFQRARIPDEHWKAVSDAGLATLEELAAASAARKAA